MTSESLTVTTDSAIEKPDISQLVGEDGAFGKMLCDVDSLMESQYKKGRIKGTDYAQVLSDSIQSTIKSATDFVIQRELIAAQALYYKWQAEKFKRDSILITSQEIKMKAELANEVLKGCFTKEQTLTQVEQTNKVAKEALHIEEETKKTIKETLLVVEQTNKVTKEALHIEENTKKVTQEIVNLKQTKLKLVEETAVTHKQIAEVVAKTNNIMQNTSLQWEQTKHEVKKKLVTEEQIDLVHNQADHEIAKKANTEEDTDFTAEKILHETAKTKDTKAHTDWMKEHENVEHELVGYTKAKADLERKRIDVETKRIKLMQAQIDLEKARLPLLCAQTKVELRKADVMAYDAIYRKVSAMVQAREVAVKKAEVALMCARTKSEQTKAYLTKYQALGILEQSKTEQVKREVAKYSILEAKAKAKAMIAQITTSLANAQLLKQKVKTELAQGKVLEGKLELFAAQYAGLVNDGKLRNQKLQDDVRVAQATLALDGDVTGLDAESVDLAEVVAITTSITAADEVTLAEEDSSIDFEVTESQLPEGDTIPDLTCEPDEEELDISLDSIPLSDLDCASGEMTTSTPTPPTPPPAP